MKTFNLPDLGEGLPDAEVVEWHVKEGDTVKTDEPLVSMETAKAVVEVPSPFTGKVAKLYGEKGTVIQTGKPLVDFDIEDARQDTGTVVGKVEVGNEVVSEKATSVSQRAKGVKVLPAVRALAKKLGVDLASVTPTGKDGLITADDVNNAAQAYAQAGDLEPLRGVRRAMASAMSQSHAEVVPVTIYDDADITEWKEKDYTVRLLNALAKACEKENALNAWFDGKAVGRRLLSTVDVGLAMDTEDGLFVPVIKDVASKEPNALRTEVETLKKEVQSRSIAQEKLRNPSITLSNFGRFAGRYASPIIVPPTVAIIAVGKIREEVRPIKGDPMVRNILPISLTFDHRAVTGGEATRFLGVMLEELAKPS